MDNLTEKVVATGTALAVAAFGWVWKVDRRVGAIEEREREREKRSDERHQENLNRLDKLQGSIDDVRNRL
jgi:hypothetical protein